MTSPYTIITMTLGFIGLIILSGCTERSEATQDSPASRCINVEDLYDKRKTPIDIATEVEHGLPVCLRGTIHEMYESRSTPEEIAVIRMGKGDEFKLYKFGLIGIKDAQVKERIQVQCYGRSPIKIVALPLFHCKRDK